MIQTQIIHNLKGELVSSNILLHSLKCEFMAIPYLNKPYFSDWQKRINFQLARNETLLKELE